MKRAVLCNIRFEHYSKAPEEKAFSVEPNQPSQILLGPHTRALFLPFTKSHNHVYTKKVPNGTRDWSPELGAQPPTVIAAFLLAEPTDTF